MNVGVTKAGNDTRSASFSYCEYKKLICYYIRKNHSAYQSHYRKVQPQG